MPGSSPGQLSWHGRQTGGGLLVLGYRIDRAMGRRADLLSAISQQVLRIRSSTYRRRHKTQYDRHGDWSSGTGCHTVVRVGRTRGRGKGMAPCSVSRDE